MDVAILAGRVPHEDRLYVIGPFAERVSFASQQRRALSLVCAIDNEIRRGGDADGLKGKRACVVGAGLAGLTCSAGLAAFECDNWILEAGRSPLNINRMARHREIHPSINFWPRENVVVTTLLPFLNWYQDRCDLLLERLLTKWKFLEEKKSQIKGVTLGCKVTGIEWAGNGWKMVGGPKAPPGHVFDLVIFATGFGEENPLPNSGTPGYWNAELDRIDKLRKHPTGAVANCVIAGTGDGGLIEALRLLYRKFQAGKVNYGTEELLDSLAMRRRLEAVESRVRLRVSDEILRAGFPLDDQFKDEISRDLWAAYDAEFSELSSSFRRALAEQRSSVQRVILVGERDRPTVHTSAPYHRLLIVHAIREGWLEYHQVRKGDLHVEDSSLPTDAYPEAYDLEIPLKKVAFRSIGTITSVNHEAQIDATERNVALEGALFLSRHGTTSPLKAILDPISPDLLGNIQKRQSLYADQDWISMDQARDLAQRLKLPQPGPSKQWLQQAFEDARDFFKKRYGLDVQEEWTNPPKFLLYNEAGSGWADENESGPIPTTFFGIEVNGNDLFEVPTVGWGGH